MGIGRGLATPLLPHHLAYGSRTKAVRSRLSFDVQPGYAKAVEIPARQGDSESGTAVMVGHQAKGGDMKIPHFYRLLQDI